MAYVGQTRSRALIALLRAEGLGECTNRGEFPPRRTPWFYDNGAFGDWRAGRPWDQPRWESELALAEAHDPPPDFVVCPDLVGEGAVSLAHSLRFAQAIRRPAYLAVQDGMTEEEVAAALGPFAGVFVGGTLPWKLRTGGDWVRFAHRHGLPCHIGRVGTARRVRWALDCGADSIDSCLPLWSAGQLRVFLAALKSTQRRLFS